ncbi:MAG: hypothetical protein HFJ50_06855 [Clostridia bacterium]|nr:hypothetical protein [Clostridia bacterium]
MLGRIVDITAGKNGSAGVNEFGWVFTWGNGTYGEIGDGENISRNSPTKTNIITGISVSRGDAHTGILAQNGYLYTCRKKQQRKAEE